MKKKEMVKDVYISEEKESKLAVWKEVKSRY